MELMQLKYFVALANSDSMIKASEVLRVSQSSISISLKKLEDELGVSLFVKKGRKLCLTNIGKIFLEGASKILMDLDALCEQIQPENKNSVVSISIEGAVEYATATILIYSRFFPDTHFNQTRADRNAAKASLLTQQADLCVSMENYEDTNIESVLLLEEPMQLLFSNSHNLSKQHYISIKDLKNEVLVTLKEGHGIRTLHDSYFSITGIYPKAVFEVGDLESMGQSVKRNFGFTFIPRSLANTLLSSGNTELPGASFVQIKEPYCQREVYVSYLKKRKLPPHCKAFLSFLIEFGSLTAQNNRFPTIEKIKQKMGW